MSSPLALPIDERGTGLSNEVGGVLHPLIRRIRNAGGADRETRGWPAPTVSSVGWLVMLGADCGDQPENQITGFVAASRRGSLFVTPIVWTLANETGVEPSRAVFCIARTHSVLRKPTGSHIRAGVKAAVDP